MRCREWIAGAVLVLACPLHAAPPAPTASYAAIRDALWAKERAIYEGRGRGDISAYLNNSSDAYVSWPPSFDAPIDHAKLMSARDGKPKPSHEKLEMTYRAMALSGDTAVIYYSTHMTVAADGALVDLRYDVTHSWVRENGSWRVLGGMARPRIK